MIFFGIHPIQSIETSGKKRMQYTDITKRLFQWNTVNLVKSAELKKSDIGHYFAQSFRVKANGRNYEANYDSYFDFLNQFRSTIRSICYDFHEFIEHEATVVVPLTAHIVRIDKKSENFEAILILKFNQVGKIILWHEVYIKI